MRAKISFLATDSIPKVFDPVIIPDDLLIHKGIFSSDITEYYYTLSDQNFEQFDLYVIKFQEGKWSSPKPAFFNSAYNEHGMSFSPNGNTLYFSSTRPIPEKINENTWQIWKSDKVNGSWNTAEHIKFSNLEGKLTSHPSVTKSGTIYFHSSNPDYSEMHLYSAKLNGENYEIAEKVILPDYEDVGSCTPFISPNEDYLIFAAISDRLELMISFRDSNGDWHKPRILQESINTNCQGNPFVTSDNANLIFTAGDPSGENWKIQSIKFKPILESLKRQ